MISISGYTTSYQCLARKYPLELCIKSLLGFCDEVSIVDSGSTDGTIELIEALAKKESRIKFSINPVDFNHPRWAIYMDGLQKAKAREACTAEYCWQTDNDEIVVEHDFARIRKLPSMVKEVFDEFPIIYLPMVEFWGSFDRTRADFFTWKQRMSKNDKRMTHGIPNEYRMLDSNGHEYPRPFESDTCNYIYRDTKESVKSVVPIQVPRFDMPPQEFDVFFHEALNLLPSVLHVSWLNLTRKIEHYREFWPKFHSSMYNLDKIDSPENNVMFSKSWGEVTDADIAVKAKELDELGPRAFHHKLDPSKQGATVKFRGVVPQTLKDWAENNL